MWLIVLAATAVCAQEATPAKKPAAKPMGGGGGTAAAIEKMDKDRMDAIIKGDTDAVDKATGDNYVFTDGTGRVTTKKELMDDLKAGKLKLESVSISDVKVHFYGNTAVETSKLVQKGTRDGKDTSGTYRFTRVWVNKAGTWQTVALQETKTQ